MNPPIEDLRDYLDANEITLTPGENLFITQLPETGLLDVACLFDISGGSPSPTEIQFPAIQVLVRGTKGYKAAYTFMELVLGHLHGLANTTINGTFYIVLWKITEIESLGRDKKGRPLLSCNLRLQRTTT